MSDIDPVAVMHAQMMQPRVRDRTALLIEFIAELKRANERLRAELKRQQEQVSK